MKNILLILTLISGAVVPAGPVSAQEPVWARVDRGLEIGEFDAPKSSIVGDSRITIVRIDPHLYSFRLLCSGELGHSKMTAKQWCRKYEMIAVINAGMFLPDQQSNVGYMKNFGYVNNPRINPKYKSVVAFNPVDAAGDPFRIYDIDEHDMEEITGKYHTVIQNLRLIKSPAENRWSQQERIWTEAALGQDRDGNVLFIFSRSPYSMFDLNNILIGLPIGIDNVQHLEGGPEASLYFSFENVTVGKMGSYETGFNENDLISNFWTIPNVIGLQKSQSYDTRQEQSP